AGVLPRQRPHRLPVLRSRSSLGRGPDQGSRDYPGGRFDDARAVRLAARMQPRRQSAPLQRRTRAMTRDVAGGLESFRLEILSNAPHAIAEEIQLTIPRTAYSHNVKEGHDASTAVFTARGHIAAQPVAIPGHLGSMKFMVEEVL